jgi:polyketide biosynthesis enoyl-CoA hydratase PksH
MLSRSAAARLRSLTVAMPPGAADPETIRVAEDAGLLRVTLRRPERQNSIDDALLSDLDGALDAAERSAGCRVVLLEGEGGVFSAGMDMREAARQPPDERAGGAFLRLLERFTTVPRAIISCVDGRVMGGGVGLAAASDFVFATERSQFGLPEALWGLLPCCVLPFLVRRVGFQKAYAMTLSTQPVGAREAERFHLVDHVTNEPELLMRRLLFRISKLDPRTIGDLKRYCKRMWFPPDETEAFALEEFGRLMASPLVRRRISDYATSQKLPWER